MYILLALQSFNSHLSLVLQHQQPNGWNNFYHAAHYRPLPSTVTSRAANCPYIAPKSKGMKEYPRWSWILNNYVKTWKNTVSPSVEPNSNQIASLLEAINCPSDLFLFPFHLLLLIVVLQAHGKKRRKQCGSSGRFQPNYIYSNVYLASKGSKLSKQTDGFTALLIQLTTRVVQAVPLCMGQVGISNFVCVRPLPGCMAM